MMNEQNEALHTSNTVIHQAKRRRGRPRKEGILLNKEAGSSQASPVNTVSETVTTIQHTVAMTNDENMIGKPVSGVIDGCFDAGYFLSVRIGNNGPLLRGVVFEPGRVIPITSTNDIAPQAKFHQRTDIPVLGLSPRNHFSDVGFQSEKVTNQPLQLSDKSPVGFSHVLSPVAEPSASFTMRNQSAYSVVPMANLPDNISNPSLPEKMVMRQNENFKYGSHYKPSPSVENLRMVEQDDVMQVYEVSVQSEGQNRDTESAKNAISHSAPAHQSQNQDMGSGLHLSPHIHNDFLHCTHALHPGAVEHQFVDMEQNQITCNKFKGSYYSAQQHNDVIAEKPSLAQHSPHNKGGFQERASIQEDIRDEHLELEDTSVVAQSQVNASKDQEMDTEHETEKILENEIRRPNQELFQSPADEVEPTRNAFGADSHPLLLGGIINAKANSPRFDMRQENQLETEAKISANDQKNISAANEAAENDEKQAHSQATRVKRVTMPLDLEIGAEESIQPPRPGPEFHFSSSSGCYTERSIR